MAAGNHHFIRSLGTGHLSDDVVARDFARIVVTDFQGDRDRLSAIEQRLEDVRISV